MESRLTNILIAVAVFVALAVGGLKVIHYLAARSGPAYARKFGAELSRIRHDLGTSSSLNVSYNYRRGEPVKDVVDHIAIQTGVPITYTGTGKTGNGLGYTGNLAAGLANFCANEDLTFSQTAAGKFELKKK